MKGIIAFAILCLVASSVSVTGKHHSEKSHGLSKLSREVCTTTCTQTGPSNSNNWVVIWQGKVFIYNGDDKWFGFLDIKTNIAFIFDANTKVAGIFNLNTNSKGGLIISFDTGYAKYIDLTLAQINAFAGQNFTAGFDVLIGLVTSNASSVGAGANVTTGLVFDLAAVIKNLGTGGLSAVAALAARADLLAKLNTSFGAIFNTLGGLIASGAINASTGAVGILAGIIDIKIKLGAALVNFLTVLVTRPNAPAFFVSALFDQLQAALTSHIEADIITAIDAISSAALLVGKIYSSVTGAVNAIIDKSIQYANQTSVTIGGVEYSIVLSLSAAKSFTIAITSSTLDLVISYDAASNAIIVWNKSIGYLVAFVGKAGYWAVFNTATGGAIAINKLTGLAVFVDGSASAIAAAFAPASLNIQAGFQLVISATTAAGATIGSIVSGSVFSINAIIVALKTSSSSFLYLASVFNFSVRSKLDAQFSKLFLILNNSFKTNYNVAFGGFNLLIGIFSTALKALVNPLVKFFVNIYTKLNGLFNSDVAGSFFASFSVEISDGFSGAALTALNGIFNALVDGAVTTYNGLSAAISGLFKGTGSVSVGGSVGGGVSGGGGGGGGGGFSIGI